MPSEAGNDDARSANDRPDTFCNLSASWFTHAKPNECQAEQREASQKGKEADPRATVLLKLRDQEGIAQAEVLAPHYKRKVADSTQALKKRGACYREYLLSVHAA